MTKIITLPTLKKILNQPQLRTKKKVLVTGCFDFLHQEHQKFLKKAKQTGDILIVGLEPDLRVKKLKGPGRPLNSSQKRAHALIQFYKVDFVLVLADNFGHPQTRRKVLQKIMPHVLAISAKDPRRLQKEKECHAIGCQVKVVHQYNPHVSTTKLLNDSIK